MLQALVDQLREGVVVVRDGHIALMNPAAAQLLNLPPDADSITHLAGRPVDDGIFHEPLCSLLLNGHRDDEAASVEGQGLAQPVTRVRLEVDTPKGPRYLLAQASDLVVSATDGDRNGPLGRVLVLTDISELQRTIQMRADFVANASHELRTPLATIRAATETLLGMDLQEDADAAAKFLQAIDRNGERLERLVADLLDLSRLETPKARFEPESVEVRSVLDDLAARFAESLRRKRLHWEAICEPPEVRTVQVNPHLLRLVLDNLVENAIKFTDRGGHVTVRLNHASDAAVFEVIDDGCGIPKGEQQRVFERFYQVKQDRSGEERGTGLGLSIVRHAVGTMNGKVKLKSELGKGTRVIVTIPQTHATTLTARRDYEATAH